MNEKTMLYQLTETSEFMMSFVIITKNNNAIVIDGGRKEDMPLLKKYVGKRHISAWILTHAHIDHISGFVSEFYENGLRDFDIETVYYNFPPYAALKGKTDVPDPDYLDSELEEMMPSFLPLLDKVPELFHFTVQGESVTVDECRIDFIYSYHEGLYTNLMNDSSLVFMVKTDKTRVLFLGDLGPRGGDVLYDESRHLLRADIVQMAHHGHMNVSMEVYEAIKPRACLWCCPDWLYNEPEIPRYLEDRERLFSIGRERMYGVKVTRGWMESLGVREHYVTMDGTHEIEI